MHRGAGFNLRPIFAVIRHACKFQNDPLTFKQVLGERETMLDTYSPSWMTEDLEIFKDAVNKFYTREFVLTAIAGPKRALSIATLGTRPRSGHFMRASIPEEYGGGGELTPMKPF